MRPDHKVHLCTGALETSIFNQEIGPNASNGMDYSYWSYCQIYQSMINQME